MVAQIVTACLTAVLLENVIFTRLMGTSTMLTIARKQRYILPFGVCIVFISTASSALFYAFSLLLRNNEYLRISLQAFFSVVSVGIVYILLLLGASLICPGVFRKARKFIHLSALNCAVMGALLLSMQSSLGIWGCIGYGFGAGVGFTLATFLVSIAYPRIYSAKISRTFRGLPAMLIYIAILSLAFYGLIGHELPF